LQCIEQKLQAVVSATLQGTEICCSEGVLTGDQKPDPSGIGILDRQDSEDQWLPVEKSKNMASEMPWP